MDTYFRVEAQSASLSENTAAESEADKPMKTAQWLPFRMLQLSAQPPKRCREIQALLEPNTCVLVNLCSFKEARFTVSHLPS